jgi:hypothetical protein
MPQPSGRLEVKFERTFQARSVGNCFLCVRHLGNGARHPELADGLVLAEAFPFERDSMTKPGSDLDGISQSEADHIVKCPACDQWFDILDLSQVIQHVHDAEIEVLDEQWHKRQTH